MPPGRQVYQEAEGSEGQGGAIMVSAVVRSTPSAAFHVRPGNKRVGPAQRSRHEHGTLDRLRACSHASCRRGCKHAGPCLSESEAQLSDTAVFVRQALLDLGPDLHFVGRQRTEQADAHSRLLLCTFLPTGNMMRYVRGPSCPLAQRGAHPRP